MTWVGAAVVLRPAIDERLPNRLSGKPIEQETARSTSAGCEISKTTRPLPGRSGFKMAIVRARGDHCFSPKRQIDSASFQRRWRASTPSSIRQGQCVCRGFQAPARPQPLVRTSHTPETCTCGLQRKADGGAPVALGHFFARAGDIWGRVKECSIRILLSRSGFFDHDWPEQRAGQFENSGL